MKKHILLFIVAVLSCGTAFSQYGIAHRPAIKLSLGTDVNRSCTTSLDESYSNQGFDEHGFFQLYLHNATINHSSRYFIAVDGKLSHNKLYYLDGGLKLSFDKTGFNIWGRKTYANDNTNNLEYYYEYETSNLGVGISFSGGLKLLNNRINLGVGIGFLSKIPLGNLPQSYDNKPTEILDLMQAAIVPQATITLYMLDNLFIFTSYGIEKHIFNSYYGLTASEGLKYTSSFISVGLGYDFLGK
jgi:hypothetical protein